MSAEQGHIDSQSRLGTLYKGGTGVAQNNVLAVRWLTQAADNGDANAQHNLAGCYRSGQGVARNPAAAAQLYKAAADQGRTVQVEPS